MAVKTSKKVLRRRKIRYKIRKKIQGTGTRPRLSIFRSNKYIYAQLIDDLQGRTLASACSKDEAIAAQKLARLEDAKAVGKSLGEQAKGLGIETILFDRSGYLYHGRVKSLADGAREAGLQF